ncbi:dipeptide ABC transporter ATP-binding protein [Neisseria leonii]|uniref:Dipeptide ABC transporter ATP-binding protein n=2 Tax=Neisseria leonii TaxID=2995413 RepID=A0A9X4ICR4_9NEIS|nr:dipeptide ABC transporter ATP-binding protein [Neisseria sp. 51.81]MDD9326906.1 dipeptide ABC transporter ATP-binding protein [Neisseria sp. 51.81]
MLMAILTIENLNAAFDGKPVLHDISLSLPAGRKMALVGESGSGKTVLAQSIMRLNPAVSLNGTLRFDGTDILALGPRALQSLRGRRIGMVFQEPMSALNPVMRVGRQIAEVLTLHLGLDKKQAWHTAVAWLDKTGLHDAGQKAHAYPFQLSGGERQRAMIAMAVAAEPQLLIADEPTTALDASVRIQILDLLERLQAERQMALLYITHDLNLVRRFADDVAVMRQGSIVEQGRMQDVFSRPRHAYTRLLIDTVPQRLAQAVPETATPPVLAAENLSVAVSEKQGWFARRQKTLLHPLSFGLAAGQTLGIIGGSGSGKTTLAKALLRLMRAQGRLKIRGRDWDGSARRRIQMVFQDPFGAFNPRMTVLQIVAEGLTVYEPGLPRKEVEIRVRQMLQKVGLPDDILARYPHQFSGGQRQRLAIARALIVRPDVLVLDEPTSALDVQRQHQILTLLAGLQQTEGTAYILISHDLAVIRALAHRVMVLHNGRVVEEGDCGTVFAAPNHAYTKKLLSHDAP